MSTVDPDIKVFMGRSGRGLSLPKIIGNILIIIIFTFIYGFWIDAKEGQSLTDKLSNGIYQATVGWLGAIKPSDNIGKLMHGLHAFLVLMFNFCYD